MINEKAILYKVADAIRKELATMNASVIVEMAKEDIDQTPFNILAETAIRTMYDAILNFE